jgi:hypothetical protein
VKPYYRVKYNDQILACGSHEDCQKVVAMHKNCKHMSKSAYCSTLLLMIEEVQAEYPPPNASGHTNLGFTPYVPPPIKGL